MEWSPLRRAEGEQAESEKVCTVEMDGWVSETGGWMNEVDEGTG